MRAAALAISAFALALAGCGSNADDGDGNGRGEPQAPAAGAGGAVPERSGFASVYTGFDLAQCEVLSENREEGSYATYRCPGFGQTALFVQEGDGRFDLDAGVDDDGFQTLSAFNGIADTVEWRLEGDRPIAAIFRFEDLSERAEGRTVLAVEKVGTAEALGCRIAQIAGKTPQANERAREFADASASIGGFDCAKDETEFVGNAR